MSLLIQAASYVGNYLPGNVVQFKFNSTDAAGTLTAITSPTVKVYKDADTAESTAGVTLTAGFDGVTGLYHVQIDTGADTDFYTAGSDFEAVLTAGSVGLVSVAGTTVGHFGLSNRAAIPDPGYGVNVTAVSGDGTAAANLAALAGQLLADSVNDSSFAPTTSAFETNSTTDLDLYSGHVLVFVGLAANAKAFRTVTHYQFADGRVKLTVSPPLPQAPANGDSFLVVGAAATLTPQGMDAVIPPDPAAVPVLGTDSLPAWIGYFGAWSVNEVRDTATDAKLRDSANASDLATHALSDSGGTFTSGPAT